MTTDVQQLDLQNSCDEILAQLRFDLESLLKDCRNIKNTVRLVATKTGIHEKTLFRVLKEDRRPSYLTLFRFYRYFFNTTNDEEVIRKSPDVIKKYLEKSAKKQNSFALSFNREIDQELINNPIFGEIYMLLATGELHRLEIKERFGHYGLVLMDKILSLKLATEVRRDVYVQGPVSINLSPESILHLGQHLTRTYASVKRGDMHGENFHGFYVEGLSIEGLNEWLRIDEQAYAKKCEILKNQRYLGKIKTFTFMVTDQMKLGKKNMSAPSKVCELELVKIQHEEGLTSHSLLNVHW